MRAADGKSKPIAIAGILLAFLISLLYLKTIIPAFDMSIYVLASFIPSVVLIESKPRIAWLFYFASVLLGLLLPVDKLSLLFYFSFFGYYGILKYHIEKISSRVTGFILKLLVCYSALALNYYAAGVFLPGYVPETMSFVILLIVATPFLFIYDYLYTLAIVFYMKRIGGSKWKG